MIYKKPEEIKFTPQQVDDESYLRYFESASEIDRRCDQLVPRNDVPNPEIIIQKGEYLSRISSLKRKYLGVQYRYEKWEKVVGAHKKSFHESVRNWRKHEGDAQELQDSKYSSRTSLSRGFGLSGRDLKVENEFEVFVSSVVSLSSVLARFIASFLKGSESSHSISKIESILKDKPSFKELYNVVLAANKNWLNELKTRRDSSTHYIMLSALSKYSYWQESSGEFENIVIVGIPRNPTKGKSVSMWNEDIPVIGGQRDHSWSIKIGEDIEIEAHEIFDIRGRSLFRHNGKLPNNLSLIDGETYLHDVNKYLDAFIIEVLAILSKKVKCV